jgi:hypothetical protein
VPLTAFFRRFEEERNAVFVKAGEGVDVERRGTRAGHQYNLLGHIGSNTAGVVVEPYLITLTEDSDVFPMFQHEGMEFLYMLEGEVVYRHGSNLYRMTARRQPVLRRRCAARPGRADAAADPLSLDHLLSARLERRLSCRTPQHENEKGGDVIASFFSLGSTLLKSRVDKNPSPG